MDPLNGRVLLWIDNSLDTWYNRLYDSSAIGSASATLTLTGLDPATYTIEWWDTTTGIITNQEAIATDIYGDLDLVINHLNTDTAIKIFTLSYTGLNPP
jgi:hypothetical protein